MTAPAAWAPPTKGPLEINWPRALAPTTRFDPYLVWRDATLAVVSLPVILELNGAFDEPALRHLNSLGVWVAPHYIDFKMPNGKAPKFVTGICKKSGSAGMLFAAVAAGVGPVARYELSAGFANPDYMLEALRQPWEPAEAIDPLPGKSVVGFIDYGCAFLHEHFLRSDRSRRVHALWNQEHDKGATPTGKTALAWQPASRFAEGWFVDATHIEAFAKQYLRGAGIDELSCYRDAQYEPIRRHSTHGSFVMDVATGHPAPMLHPGRASARHDHPIVFVQLPRHVSGQQVSGLLRAQVLDAAHFIALHVANNERGVINLSYGGYCGPHDGSSIVELALDELLDAYGDRFGLVVASGNALDQAIHAQLYLRSGESDAITWENLPDDPSDSFVELWWPEGSAVRLRVIAPGGVASSWVGAGDVSVLTRQGKTAAMLSACGQPCQSKPGSGSMALLAVAATALGTAPYGLWRIEVENSAGNTVLVDAWCERDDPVFGNEAGPRQSRFIDNVERTGTLNALAHGRRSIVVGGYVLHDTARVISEGSVGPMSGTGPGRGLPGRQRHPPHDGIAAADGPEVLAPCDSGFEDGLAAAAVLSGDEVRLAGTSVAAARYTRAYIDNAFSVPTTKAPPPGPALVPGREAHPDEALCTPRIP